MKILQIALITQKGNVFNVKMQIDEIVFESKEEVRENYFLYLPIGRML